MPAASSCTPGNAPPASRYGLHDLLQAGSISRLPFPLLCIHIHIHLQEWLKGQSGPLLGFLLLFVALRRSILLDCMLCWKGSAHA